MHQNPHWDGIRLVVTRKLYPTSCRVRGWSKLKPETTSNFQNADHPSKYQTLPLNVCCEREEVSEHGFMD